MTALLNELRQLETELQQPQCRDNARRLDELLHPDFYEVGRSGQTYDRNAIIEHLSAQRSRPIVPWNFSVRVFGAGAALLTYCSAHRQPGGELSDQTYRSSIWLKVANGWQLLYHQGTPISA